MLNPSEESWPSMIAEIKTHFGLKIKPQPHQQRITIFKKTNRRVFTNYEELASHLRERFDVEVDLWEPSSVSLPEQIKFLEKTTVAISPCGGISYGTLFLPPGASAVFAE